MWGICSASSSSSVWSRWFVGFAVVHHHRPRASPSQSRPHGLICFGSISLGLLPPFSAPAVVSPPSRRLDGICNPDVFSRYGAVLGRLAVRTVLLRRRRSPLDGGVAATTVATPTVSPPWSSPSSSTSSPMSPPLTPSVYAFMTWWPGHWARHACLLQLCRAWSCV
jgi:hypothetical protein